MWLVLFATVATLDLKGVSGKPRHLPSRDLPISWVLADNVMGPCHLVMGHLAQSKRTGQSSHSPPRCKDTVNSRSIGSATPTVSLRGHLMSPDCVQWAKGQAGARSQGGVTGQSTLLCQRQPSCRPWATSGGWRQTWCRRIARDVRTI